MAPARQLAISLALFLAAFLLVSTGIRRALPWSNSSASLAQLRAFESHKDLYDAVYLGSSHVLHSFQPSVIDRELTQAGRPFRSYNLGTDGMFSFGTHALLERVLEMRPARLRYVILEAPSWRPRAGMNLDFERHADWHDPVATGYALLSVMRSELPLTERLQAAGAHLSLAFRWLSNYGRGPRLWQGIFPSRSQRASLAAAEASAFEQGGYVALEDSDEEVTLLRHQIFLAGRERYLAKIEAARQGPRSPTAPLAQLERYNYAALAWQQRLLARRGVRGIYVVPASLKGPRYFSALVREGAMANLVEMRSPQKHPELFAPEHRFDEGHLNRRGAEIFGELFAAKLLSWLERLDARSER